MEERRGGEGGQAATSRKMRRKKWRKAAEQRGRDGEGERNHEASPQDLDLKESCVPFPLSSVLKFSQFLYT